MLAASRPCENYRRQRPTGDSLPETPKGVPRGEHMTDDFPDEFIPDENIRIDSIDGGSRDEIRIEPLEYEYDEGGVVHGLTPERDAPKVIVLNGEGRRYRVTQEGAQGHFVTLDAWECSCGLDEILGRCIHLHAAAAYDHRRGGDGEI